MNEEYQIVVRDVGSYFSTGIALAQLMIYLNEKTMCLIV